MAYEHELCPLRAWLAKHPGLNVTALKKTIKDVPWPAGYPDAWVRPCDGTRLDVSVPSLSGLEWKLRYLELHNIASAARCQYKTGNKP